MEVNCNFCPFWSASLLKGGYRVGFVVKPASLLKAWVSCRFFILIGCQLFLEFVLFNSFTVVVEDKAIFFSLCNKTIFVFWHSVGSVVLLPREGPLCLRNCDGGCISRAYYAFFWRRCMLMTWFWHSFSSLFNVQWSLEYMSRSNFWSFLLSQ